MVTWSETEFTHEGSMTRFDKAQDSLTTFMNCPILFDSRRGETISPCPPLNGKTTLTLQKNLWHGGCIILPRAYLTVDLDEVRHQS